MTAKRMCARERKGGLEEIFYVFMEEEFLGLLQRCQKQKKRKGKMSIPIFESFRIMVLSHSLFPWKNECLSSLFIQVRKNLLIGSQGLAIFFSLVNSTQPFGLFREPTTQKIVLEDDVLTLPKTVGTIILCK